MNPGIYDQIVIIERQTKVKDATGQLVNAWMPVVTTNAAVEPLSGDEYLKAGAMTAVVTTRIKMRYRPGIKAADRVSHRGLTYNVTSVIDLKSARRELVLMCKTNPV